MLGFAANNRYFLLGSRFRAAQASSLGCGQNNSKSTSQGTTCRCCAEPNLLAISLLCTMTASTHRLKYAVAATEILLNQPIRPRAFTVPRTSLPWYVTTTGTFHCVRATMPA